MLTALEEQILRREHHAATVYKGRQRSFSDLDLYSRRLAEVLRVPPDNTVAPPGVAACITDADDTVLGFLASLRLSACCTPLRASSSQAVLASVMEEWRPWCVLVDSGMASRLSQNQRTLNIEEYLREEGTTTEKAALRQNGSPGGSTRQASTRPLLQILGDEADGRCSLCIERCLSRRQWEWKEWPANDLETVAVLDDVDSARFWEDVLSALCSGSTVALAAEEEKRSPSALLKFLQDASATRVEMTPDKLWALLKRASLERETPLPRLKLVKCSRGLVTTQLVRLFHRVLPHTGLVYVYEQAGHCCVYQCPAEIEELRHHRIANGDFVVLGKPVGDCRAVVRDAGLAECPQGVIGAICLGSIKGDDTVSTGDTGFVDSDGYIVLTSRSTPRIDGRKVDMALIRDCLKDIPVVSDSELCWEYVTRGQATLVAFYWSEAGGERSGELLHHLNSKVPARWLPHLFPLGPPPTDRRPDADALLSDYSAAVGKLLSCGESNVLRGAPVLVAIARSLKVPVAQIDVDASYSRHASATSGAASAAEASALLEHTGYEVSVAALEGPQPVSELVECAACSLVLPGPRRTRVSLVDANTAFDEVAVMLASSFTSKNRLDTTVGNTEDQHLGNLRHLWPQIVADSASRLVHDESGRLLAVAICSDFGTEPTLPESISEQFLVICEINESMERPLRAATSARGLRMLLWFMVGSAPENKRDDNIGLVQLLLANTLYDAKRLGYAGVCSINSHVVTNMVTQRWFGFDVFDETHVADFDFRGCRPFASIRQGTLITSVYKFLKQPSS